MIDSRGAAALHGWSVRRWHYCRLSLVFAGLAIGLSQRALADPFNVGSLPGLQWWASAATSQLGQNPDGSGSVANGSPVGFISDLSGNSRNAIMGNSIVPNGDSFCPVLQTSLVGGEPGILFDGQNDFASLQSAFFE